jgi:hypothetical protein
MTSTPTRPNFMPLDPDLDEARLEQLARDKGVGVLALPAKAEKGATQKGATHLQVAPSLTEPAAPSEATSAPTPRSRMKTVNLELPDYVWTELKIRAVQRQTSLRHVVMQALVADRITIADVDMIEDGRRLR